jgi:hypothetical protein
MSDAGRSALSVEALQDLPAAFREIRNRHPLVFHAGLFGDCHAAAMLKWPDLHKLVVSPPYAEHGRFADGFISHIGVLYFKGPANRTELELYAAAAEISVLSKRCSDCLDQLTLPIRKAVLPNTVDRQGWQKFETDWWSVVYQLAWTRPSGLLAAARWHIRTNAQGRLTKVAFGTPPQLLAAPETQTQLYQGCLFSELAVDVCQASAKAVEVIIDVGKQVEQKSLAAATQAAAFSTPAPSKEQVNRETMSDQTARTKVFFSYSHKDKKWLERFQRMLKPAISGEILWDDTKIAAGSKWKEEIKEALASAKVGVLLVSDHFLASDFIAKNELPPLLNAAEKEGLRVLWVLVSDSMYGSTAIADYQAAHDPARPLDSLKGADRAKAIKIICEKVKAAAEAGGK